jgi:lactoylglutathione lyase
MAKLRHIAITVPDPEKAAKFYMDAFGLKRVGETDWSGAKGVYLSDGVMNIALLHYKTDEMAGRRGREFVGVHHFGFIVDDIAKARRKVEAAGAKHWMGEPSDGTGFYEVKYHDPDGLVFDLTENGWAGTFIAPPPRQGRIPKGGEQQASRKRGAKVDVRGSKTRGARRAKHPGPRRSPSLG